LEAARDLAHLFLAVLGAIFLDSYLSLQNLKRVREIFSEMCQQTIEEYISKGYWKKEPVYVLKQYCKQKKFEITTK